MIQDAFVQVGSASRAKLAFRDTGCRSSYCSKLVLGRTRGV